MATYSGPWKIFGRHNEILWVKKPKHGHHNDTLSEGISEFTFNDSLMGLEALDVEKLFPEEFEPLKKPDENMKAFKDEADFLDQDEEPLTEQEQTSVSSAAITSSAGIQTS